VHGILSIIDGLEAQATNSILLPRIQPR
jgi:hypothetical protein